MSESGATTAAAEPSPTPRRRLSLVAVPVIIFSLIAIMFGFALRSGDPSKLPSVLIGKPAPRLDLAPLDGLMAAGQQVPPFTAAAVGNGRPAIVNFWASWCAPCLQEHPQLMDLARSSGVALHGVNYKDQTAAARRFLGLYGNPFATVGVDPTGRAAIEWGVYGMPETFVVDRAGIVVFKHVGPITPEILRDRLLPALEKAKR